MSSSWLQHAPSEVHRVLQGLPIDDKDPASLSVEEARSACDDHFRLWLMYRFIDSQICSMDSLCVYTNTDPYDEPPASPASGPLPRLFEEDEPLGDVPRDAHLPGLLQQPDAIHPLQDAIRDHVASFYPTLYDFLLRQPHLYTHPGTELLWVCPDCGYWFDPQNLGTDEHSYLAGIADDMIEVDEDVGTISINASNQTLYLAFFDHFVYHHVQYAHLREIGVFMCFPDPRSSCPEPPTWYFTHDQPAAACSPAIHELSADLERELAQVQRDLNHRENLLRNNFRMHLKAKAQRAVKRTLHGLSVRLTRAKKDRRGERRDWVIGALAAGRSIIDTGLALVARLRREEADAGFEAQVAEYNDYSRAYSDILPTATATNPSAREGELL